MILTFLFIIRKSKKKGQYMYDKKFYKLLNYVFASEGGFNDDPDDFGGRTNFGITQIAYNEYCKKRNLQTKDVKYLSKDEAAKVYYEDYYLKSGADKQKDIRDSYILFDTAVNFDPITAKNMFEKANHNFYEMLEIRKQEHIKNSKNPKQDKFLSGWLNRIKDIEKRANELIKAPEYRPQYADITTPFDNDYAGTLQKLNIENKNEKESLRNKYLYLLNKNKNNKILTPSQKFDDELRTKYKIMQEERLKKYSWLFPLSKSNTVKSIGLGHWVTINGKPVYIECSNPSCPNW